jgi:hypothetical protein
MLFEEAAAADACTLIDYQAAQTPPGASPLEVSVGLTISDLVEISDVEQSVTMDGVLYVSWTDSRLNGVAGCRYSLDGIWHPDIQLVNAGQLSRRQDFELVVGEGGQVEGSFRVFGSVANPRFMPDFPFDSHELRLEFMSLRHDSDEVVFVRNDARTLRREVLTVPDWNVGSVRATVEETELPLAGRTVSLYRYVIPVERLARYYIYKVVFPLIMIVMMSWAVFWVNPDNLGPQMALSGTSMLTLVTFQFTMNDLLPRIGYFTQLDRFILSASCLVFLALCEAVLTGYLASHDKPQAAALVDRTSRYGFPLAFGLVVLVTLVL